MAEIEIFVKGQNITERGPLATEGEEKMWRSESGYG